MKIRNARVEDVPDIVDLIRAGSDEGVFHSQDFSLRAHEKPWNARIDALARSDAFV